MPQLEWPPNQWWAPPAPEGQNQIGEPIPPPEDIVIHNADGVLELIAGNPQMVQAIPKSIYTKLSTSSFEKSIPKDVKAGVNLFRNQRDQIRELEKELREYKGYITQRQLVDSLNRVLASKKIKRWRPEPYETKTDFLNAFVNVLWAVIPDTVKDQKDVDHT